MTIASSTSPAEAGFDVDLVVIGAGPAGLNAAGIRLGELARSVGRSAAGLTVETTAAVWTATDLIVAVPPATAVHAIDFGDHLDPAMRCVAEHTPVWMGSMAKAVARYERPFWRDRGLAGAAFSHVGPMREITT